MKYVTCGGYYVGLEVDNDGTGMIEIDGDCDTTYVQTLSECSNRELELILNNELLAYVSDEVLEYVKGCEIDIYRLVKDAFLFADSFLKKSQEYE
jgi:hypothetical protein